MSSTDINQHARDFFKMHLRAPFSLCAFYSQTQNATFSKKLCFIPNQTGFVVQLSSKRAFWVENVETNRHLVEGWATSLIHHEDLIISPKVLVLGVCMSRVEGIFWPNPPWWVKKNSTHHISPTQPTWVGLGHFEPMGWTIFFYYYYY